MRLLLSLLVLCPAIATAQPRVVTDIAPVQSLAAMVMEGVADPQVIITPGASTHHKTFRPSER